MSCEVRPINAVCRCALVLGLAAAPSSAFSQSFVCQAIRGGETATQLARRITGDARNTYQAWFQIMDPSSRLVPKSQYDRIRPGWRACIVKGKVERRVRLAVQRQAPEAPDVRRGTPQPRAAGALRPIDGVDLTLVLLGTAVILPLFVWTILDGYVARWTAVSIVMKHFARRFIREFERPLIQQPAERPLRTRFRLSPARARLEILLAPGTGRRYPNLADHRKNVQYDVVRIVRLLADDSFVVDPLFMRAGWVVVPFRFKLGQQKGVTCISSF